MEAVDVVEDQIGSDNKASINSNLEGKTVLITGAAGSIGSQLAIRCFKSECKSLVLVDISESGLFRLSSELAAIDKLKHKRVSVVLADIRNKDELNFKLGSFTFELVFHAAAYKHVPMMEHDAYSAISVNLLGSRNILDLAVSSGVKKFMLISTDKANRPYSVMGLTKLCAEHYLKGQSIIHKEIQILSLRLGNIIASSGSVYELFQQQLKRGGPITITDPEASRYFLTVNDAVALILRTTLFSRESGRFAINHGKLLKVAELANYLIEKHSSQGYSKVDIEYTGLRAGERLHESLIPENEPYSETEWKEVLRLKNHNPTEAVNPESLAKIERELLRKSPNQSIEFIKSILTNLNNTDSV